MAKKKKHRFSKKDDRQASHIAKSEKAKGKSDKEAKSIGYATVNKQKKNRRDAQGRRKLA